VFIVDISRVVICVLDYWCLVQDKICRCERSAVTIWLCHTSVAEWRLLWSFVTRNLRLCPLLLKCSGNMHVKVGFRFTEAG